MFYALLHYILLAGVYVDPMQRALCDVVIKFNGPALKEENLGKTLGDFVSTTLSDAEALESEGTEDNL